MQLRRGSWISAYGKSRGHVKNASSQSLIAWVQPELQHV
jgi:hypothetical protein